MSHLASLATSTTELITDLNVLVGSILSHDAELIELRRQVESESLDWLEKQCIICQLEDIWEQRRLKLESMSLPDLNDIFRKLYKKQQSYHACPPHHNEPHKKKKPIKVSRAMKKKIQTSHVAQSSGGTPQQQWSFLQWKNSTGASSRKK
jgi:hypothetical protein